MPKPAKNAAVVAVRNPARTRERILGAALKEFAARGFAGARVDCIARRADINKRMLYHYFGSKEKLFRAVLHHKLARRITRFNTYSSDLVDGLPLLFAQNCEDAEWVRLLAWESLQAAGQRIQNEADRRRLADNTTVLVRQQQAAGKIRTGINPAHFHLAMASLAIFPTAMQQLTRLITGKSATDPKFQREYAKFLKQIAVAFRPTRD